MFEQKKLMDVLLFGCNFSLSAHIQHFETAAGDISSCLASDGTPPRVEISSNIPQQKQKDYSLLEFFNVGINNKLSLLEIGILVCGELYLLSKYAWIPGYFLECFRSKKSQLARVGLGWQTRADAVFRSPDPRQLIKKVPEQLGQYIPSHYHDLGILKTGIWQ